VSGICRNLVHLLRQRLTLILISQGQYNGVNIGMPAVRKLNMIVC
jgi:hypothetical protein